MDLLDSNLVPGVPPPDPPNFHIHDFWISWMNLVDESRGFKSRESRGWISWMDLVDSNRVNLVDRPWGLRLQNRSWGAIF